MKKVRPTAADRNLADVWRKLKPGNYIVNVENNTTNEHILYLGPAKLKIEGSIEIELEKTIISIIPKPVRETA